MSYKITGASGAVQTKVRRGFDVVHGSFVEEVYEGAEGQVVPMIADFAGSATSWTLDHEGPHYTLTIRFAADFGDPQTSLPVDSTRIEINRVHKSIFEPPTISGVTEDELRIIREAVENPKPGQSPALTSVAAIDLYLLALKGVDSRIVYQPVLIKQRLANRQFVFDVAWARVGWVIVPGSIVGEADVGGLLRVNLPTSFGAAQDGFLWGWLKHAPSVTDSADGRIILTQEFEFGLWATSLYNFF